jgi:hypothetical protein
MTSLRRRVLRRTAATVWMLAAGLTLSPIAAALPASAVVVAAADPAVIDPSQIGSLAIHAIVGPPLDQSVYPADGTPLTLPASATPLVGAVYTVTEVTGVDLTTNAGWALAQSYRDDIDAARQHLGTVVTSAPTDSSGLTTVSNLPIGLYLVHEVPGTGQGLTAVRDFLITIPTTDPRDNQSWLYDLHVYPKRERITMTKSILGSSAGSAAIGASSAGSTITYLLESTVPSGGVRAFGGRCERSGGVDSGPGLDSRGFTADGWCASGAAYVGTSAGAAYRVVDDLTANAVSGTSNTLADYLTLTTGDWPGSVAVSLTGGGSPVSLTTCPAPTTGCQALVILAADSLTVALTDAGLSTLATAKHDHPDTTVAVRFDARVSAAGAQLLRDQLATRPTLTLPNTGEVFANDVAVSGSSPLVSNTVTLSYAALRLHKVDARTAASLPGARFSVYASLDDAKAGRDPLAVTDPSDGAGMVLIAGLPALSDPTGTGLGSYWIVETAAPSGYTGLSAPVQVTLLPDGSTDDADATGGYPVANVKVLGSGGGQGTSAGTTKSGKLAWTGAAVGPLLAAALFLIGIGVPLARRRRLAGDSG